MFILYVPKIMFKAMSIFFSHLKYHQTFSFHIILDVTISWTTIWSDVYGLQCQVTLYYQTLHTHFTYYHVDDVYQQCSDSYSVKMVSSAWEWDPNTTDTEKLCLVGCTPFSTAFISMICLMWTLHAPCSGNRKGSLHLFVCYRCIIIFISWLTATFYLNQVEFILATAAFSCFLCSVRKHLSVLAHTVGNCRTLLWEWLRKAPGFSEILPEVWVVELELARGPVLLKHFKFRFLITYLLWLN